MQGFFQDSHNLTQSEALFGEMYYDLNETTELTVGFRYDDFYNFVEDAPYVSNFLKFVGGHAITVVGYVEPLVDPRPGYNDGYWICRNSWGTTWPKGSPPHPGYFTIAMGINMCGIESRCGGIDPNISLEDIDPGSTYTSFTKYAAEYEA